MSLLMKSAAVLFALSIPMSAANARTVNISGKFTRAQIAARCDEVGGVKSNTAGKKGSYGCENFDKGTSVNCDANGKCTGWVPD